VTDDFGTKARFGAIAGLVYLATLAACGEGGNPSAALGAGDNVGATGGSGLSGTSGTSGGGNIPQGGTAQGGSSGTGGMPEPPMPPDELESAFEAPVATDRFVWTANPASGNVALIDATTHAVRLARAGFQPTTVAAIPGAEDEDGALVLNAGSADATVLRVAADGRLTTRTVETHRGANAINVSPSGRFAIAWTDAAKFAEGTLDSTDGLQDVTVLDLAEDPVSTVLSVGYRPSRVTFDAAEERALIVTEPGLSVILLGQDSRVSALVELTDNPVEDPAARDVSITPDGAIALVRIDGSTKLGLVDVVSGDRQSIELGDFVSDLDLATDGTTAFAVIGSNQSTVSTLVVIPVPVTTTDGSTFRRAIVPNVVSRSVSISPDGALALMYANVENSPYLGVLTSGDGWENWEPRALDLKAPVSAVFAAPEGPHGIAFQTTVPTSSKKGAFSLISAEGNRAPKIVGTDAAPFAVAFSPDGANAVIATRDVVVRRYGVYLVHLEHLEETLVTLPSPPLAAGIVPLANQAFVSQAHPEGRITFVNLDDGTFRTLTGFELAGRVVE
jgi:hypothetical protein